MNPASEHLTATILVVDDNEGNRALAQNTLEDEGYRVTIARGGAEAIASFEAAPPDCILLDVRMPDIDGLTVCEQIRSMPHGSDTPVIFLTAQRDIETFDRALRAGGDDFLTKPVLPTELVVRVQTALKLRQLRSEIRDHFGAMKKQRDDLMRLQLQKERLMAFVVHDLKNPVNSMDLYAQLLQREESLPARARESVAQIRTSARHLTRMIVNLLDLSKADEGKLQAKRSQVALAPLVADVLSELEASALGGHVTLKSTLGATEAFVDEDLLRRLLANLVENAIRHAPKNTAVSVTTATVDGACEFRIADAGPGVPAEMRERIFDPFVQIEEGDSRPDARTGRGLGLTFCKRAVEAHGGAIWIEDASPGSVFCVRLPATK
ncbi:MAG: hybrid sensor histidine kinase/response regulator [Thermoanaerobaculia bacterium]